MKSLVTKYCGEGAYEYISRYVDPDSSKTYVVHSTNDFNILNHNHPCNAIINLSKVNDIRFINKYFESVNSKLTNGDIFICRFETYTARQKRKRIHKIPVIGSLYFLVEFIFMRVFP